DPYFPVMPMTRDHSALAGRKSVPLSAKVIAGYDAVIVMTDHTQVDYPLVAQNARLAFDARNVFDGNGIEVAGDRLIKI
ncbi:MAG: hypothetical protein KUG58_04980, partial [Marinosulfonomonas sp.]|nr:hypothetical protein [Marinosulfonomonas sp.]